MSNKKQEVKVRKNKVVARLYALARTSSSVTLTFKDGKLEVTKYDKKGKANYNKILPVFASVFMAIPSRILNDSKNLVIKLTGRNAFAISGEYDGKKFSIDSYVSKELNSLPVVDNATISAEWFFFVRLFGLKKKANCWTNGIIKLTV